MLKKEAKMARGKAHTQNNKRHERSNSWCPLVLQNLTFDCFCIQTR